MAGSYPVRSERLAEGERSVPTPPWVPPGISAISRGETVVVDVDGLDEVVGFEGFERTSPGDQCWLQTYQCRWEFRSGRRWGRRGTRSRGLPRWQGKEVVRMIFSCRGAKWRIERASSGAGRMPRKMLIAEARCGSTKRESKKCVSGIRTNTDREDCARAASSSGSGQVPCGDAGQTWVEKISIWLSGAGVVSGGTRF